MSLPNSNSYAALGGELENYSDLEDPTTDLDAEASNEMRSDVAAMSRMCPRAYVRFSCGNPIPTNTPLIHEAVWGNDVSVVPFVARVTGGTYSITFPTSITDARGNTQTVNLRWAIGNAVNTAGYAVNSAVVQASTNVVYIYVTDIGVLTDDAIDVEVTVW